MQVVKIEVDGRQFEICVDDVLYNTIRNSAGNDNNIEFASDVIMKFFPDEPCNYNGMDDFTDCEYCSENCGKHEIKECWKNAIKEKWHERLSRK